MLRMQTLGLTDAGERSDSRMKSLFWPSEQSGADVDYLGAQGYWISTLIAVVSLVFLTAAGQTFSRHHPSAVLLFQRRRRPPARP
jgi:hypothetical protein